MRLVHHVAPGHSPKAIALRNSVRAQFQQNKSLTNPVEIDNAKAGAVRALANYMLFESGAKDAQVSKAMSNFHTTSVEQAKNITVKRDEKEEDDEKNEKDLWGALLVALK